VSWHLLLASGLFSVSGEITEEKSSLWGAFLSNTKSEIDIYLEELNDEEKYACYQYINHQAMTEQMASFNLLKSAKNA
jgi:hypothetical protein